MITIISAKPDSTMVSFWLVTEKMRKQARSTGSQKILGVLIGVSKAISDLREMMI